MISLKDNNTANNMASRINSYTKNLEEKEFLLLLKDTEKRLQKTEFELHNGHLVVREHYNDIKRLIEQAKEKRLSEIAALFDSLMQKVDKCETESFAGSLKINQENCEKRLNEFKLFMYKYQNYKSGDKISKEELANLKDVNGKLMVEQEKLKQLNFNNGLFNYREHRCKIDENMLGRLVYYPTETIKVDLFEIIDYGSYLNSMLREKYYNYPNKVEEIKHIDIEGTGFLANGNFIILSIYYDNLDDSLNHLNIFQFDESRELINLKRIEDVNLDDTIFKIVGNKICLNYKNDYDNIYFLKVLDEQLITLVTIKIENKTLVGADKEFIYCLSTDEKDPFPLHIYDWSLELVNKIGQRINSEIPFYFPKFCSQLFTLVSNERKYYVIYISDYINIVDGVTGDSVKSIERYGFKIEVDSKNNIISFNRRSISYFNSHGYLLKEIQVVEFPKNTCNFWSIDNNDNLYYFDPEKFYLAI